MLITMMIHEDPESQPKYVGQIKEYADLFVKTLYKKKTYKKKVYSRHEKRLQLEKGQLFP
jgi:hypothetical protein